MGAQNNKSFQELVYDDSREEKEALRKNLVGHLSIVKDNKHKANTSVSDSGQRSSSEVQGDIASKKIFTPALIILLACMTAATIASFGNSALFWQLLACDLIIVGAIFLKSAAPSINR